MPRAVHAVFDMYTANACLCEHVRTMEAVYKMQSFIASWVDISMDTLEQSLSMSGLYSIGAKTVENCGLWGHHMWLH